MAHVMLKRDWPGKFRRTIRSGRDGRGKPVLLEFEPGVPVDLKAHEIKQLEPEIGVCLEPVEMDDKQRPRIITDEVEAAEDVTV